MPKTGKIVSNTMTDKIDVSKEVAPSVEELEQVTGGIYKLKDCIVTSVKKSDS